MLITVVIIAIDISQKIDEFIEKKVPLQEIIFDFYVNFIPYFINLFSYLFVFISVIFFTSKMTSNTEIVAILSGGVSYRRLLVPYMLASTFLAIFSFVLASYIIPYTNKARLNFEYKYLKNLTLENDQIHKEIEPGTFIYIQRYDNVSNTAYKFSIEKFKNKELKYKLLADRIVWNNKKKLWELYDYVARDIDGLNEKLTKGTIIESNVNIKPGDFSLITEFQETMNFNELSRFIDKQISEGAKNVEKYEVEKQKRIAFPFSCFILTIIGVSLSTRKRKGGLGYHLGFGIFLSFVYILFLQISQTYALTGILNPFIAVWLPNFVFGLIAFILYKLASK